MSDDVKRWNWYPTCMLHSVDGLYVRIGEYERLRAEVAGYKAREGGNKRALEKVITENTEKDKRIEDANNHHVEMQRHRDAWRKYAYGRGERPQDFLDGNMVPSERGLTRIEELEERDATWNKWYGAHMTRAATFITTEQIDAAWNRIQNLKLEWNRNSWVSSLQQATYLVQALAFFGIVACEECGGSGEWPDPRPAKDEPCPSCHGHGWVSK